MIVLPLNWLSSSAMDMPNLDIKHSLKLIRDISCYEILLPKFFQGSFFRSFLLLYLAFFVKPSLPFSFLWCVPINSRYSWLSLRRYIFFLLGIGLSFWYPWCIRVNYWDYVSGKVSFSNSSYVSATAACSALMRRNRRIKCLNGWSGEVDC